MPSKLDWYDMKLTLPRSDDKEVWRRDIPMLGFLVVTVDRDDRMTWRVCTNDSKAPSGEAPDVKTAMHVAEDVFLGILARSIWELEESLKGEKRP